MRSTTVHGAIDGRAVTIEVGKGVAEEVSDPPYTFGTERRTVMAVLISLNNVQSNDYRSR